MGKLQNYINGYTAFDEAAKTFEERKAFAEGVQEALNQARLEREKVGLVD